MALRLRNFVTLTVFPKLLTLFEIQAFDYLKVCLHLSHIRVCKCKWEVAWEMTSPSLWLPTSNTQLETKSATHRWLKVLCVTRSIFRRCWKGTWVQSRKKLSNTECGNAIRRPKRSTRSVWVGARGRFGWVHEALSRECLDWSFIGLSNATYWPWPECAQRNYKNTSVDIFLRKFRKIAAGRINDVCTFRLKGRSTWCNHSHPSTG